MAKKSRPMGYIFPKRIQSAIAGDVTKQTFYQGGLSKEEKAKFEKERLAKEKEKQDRNDVLAEARNPWYCPTCGKLMRNKLDQKYYNRKNMCMSCSIKGETYLKANGLFDKYEEEITLRNYKSYLVDIREQAIDFVSNLKDETQVVNHDGTFDTLKSDNTKVKEFMLKEVEDIDKKLEEVEDIDLSIPLKDALDVDLKEIVKNILEEEKKREQHIEENS